MTPAIADTRVAAGAATGVGESVTTSFMDHLHASNEVRSRLTGVWTVIGFRLSEATTSTHHGWTVTSRRRRFSAARIWRYQTTRCAYCSASPAVAFALRGKRSTRSHGVGRSG